MNLVLEAMEDYRQRSEREAPPDEVVLNALPGVAASVVESGGDEKVSPLVRRRRRRRMALDVAMLSVRRAVTRCAPMVVQRAVPERRAKNGPRGRGSLLLR